MKRVLVAGELNVDIILQGYRTFPEPGKEVLVDDFVMVLGSASAICAMGLARLGNPVSFLGKVGDDPWGAYCVEALTGRGIDVSRVVRDPAIKTGVTVAITSPRDRALVSFLGSINALTPEDLPLPAAPGSSRAPEKPA
jgi:sugar/nucleoside kinase (ribokinase family)